jgi:flagellar protein FlaJ
MKLTKSNYIGIGIACAMLLISAVLLLLKVSFFDSTTFYFVLGIALVIGGMPFFMSLLLESKREASINQMFLEFARDMVEGVKSGTPISKSIINTKNKDYGSLSPYVDKLANQIALGIPVKDALETFARDINSPVISRAISLIREAETSGGKIETILESVAFSVAQIEKLRKERKAAISNLTVQGYIIFLIFILIMLIMQFKILPITAQLNVGGSLEGLDSAGIGGISGGGGSGLDPKAFAMPFLFLLIAQGFFAGIIIGKISEGSVRAGLKHSFILVAIAWIVSSSANIFLK